MTSFTFREFCWRISLEHGGVTSGIPKPNNADADKTRDPARYEKQVNEYLTALQEIHPGAAGIGFGVELELDGVNPAEKWATIQNERRKRCSVQRRISPRTKSSPPRRNGTSTGGSRFRGSRGQLLDSSLNLDAARGHAAAVGLPVVIQRARPRESN